MIIDRRGREETTGGCGGSSESVRHVSWNSLLQVVSNTASTTTMYGGSNSWWEGGHSSSPSVYLPVYLSLCLYSSYSYHNLSIHRPVTYLCLAYSYIRG